MKLQDNRANQGMIHPNISELSIHPMRWLQRLSLNERPPMIAAWNEDKSP
jgi:hypothetical protein